jgi:hypothetical protein
MEAVGRIEVAGPYPVQSKEGLNMGFDKRLSQIIMEEEFRDKAYLIPSRLYSTKCEEYPSNFFDSKLPVYVTWTFWMWEQRN